MDDPVLVRGLERLGHLARDVERRRQGQRALRRLALDQFEHQAVLARRLHEPVDNPDVRVVQGCERAGFAPEENDPTGDIGGAA